MMDNIEKHPTFEKLVEHKTRSHVLIRKISDLSLSEYLAGIVPGKGLSNSTYATIAVQALERCLPSDMDEISKRKALVDFRRCPAFQVADHSGLFYDKTNFINNLLWDVALEKNGIENSFVCQCETVRAAQNMQLFLGPGFLQLRGNIYNIFGLSRNQLKNINIAAFEDAAFAFDVMKGTDDVAFPDILRSIIAASKKPGYAPNLFRAANERYWESVRYPKKRKMHLFDRRFFSDVVAANIEQETDIANAIFLSPKHRNSFLEIQRALIQSPDNLVLRSTTDLFYLRKGKELVPLRIDAGGNFYEARNGEPASIDGQPLRADKHALVHALRQHHLYPDLVIGNIFGHIMPGVVAAGGTSQIEYLPVIVGILSEFLRKHGFHQDTVNDEDHIDCGAFIGPGLLRLDTEAERFIENVGTTSDIEGFKMSCIEKKIRETLNINFWSYFDILYNRQNQPS